ncbi:MAG: mechanosensitive ion channel [Lentisphaeria bacterium]|nr:mechanosensitive ion channel [Lentisphaeria bacterium]
MQEFFKNVWKSMAESNLPGVIGAVIVLIIGWIIAAWLSGKAASFAGKCAETYRKDDETRREYTLRAGMIAGRIVFWSVMILAILACMSLLHLDYAAVPLREFTTAVAEYLPNIAGALLLLLLARIVAGTVRTLIRHLLLRPEMQNHLAGFAHGNAEKRAEYSGRIAYALIWLFFLPAVLSALNIYGITEPLQAMFAVIMTFLPRLIAAMLILWLGIRAAGIVRRGVSGAAAMMHLDKLGEMCGLHKGEDQTVAKLLGNVAWILIVIPVTAAALTALNIEALSHSVTGFLNMLLYAAGNIIGAAVILAAGAVLARIADSLVRKMVAAIGIDRFLNRISGDKNYAEKWNLPVVAGKTAMAAVLVLVVIGACEILQLTGLAELIRRFAVFGGNLILSAIVIVTGIVLADFICGISGKSNHPVYCWFIRPAVMIFTIALALSNLNIGQNIVETAFAMLLGALCVAAALAFGLGGRQFAAELLEKWSKNGFNRPQDK